MVPEVVAKLIGTVSGPPSSTEVQHVPFAELHFRLARSSHRYEYPRTSCEIGIFAPKWEVFSRFLAVKHRIGAYDGLLCPHVVPSVR